MSLLTIQFPLYGIIIENSIPVIQTFNLTIQLLIYYYFDFHI